ncbi:sugar ABC transporter permease [Mesorhizobium sp. M8A.F.Ca.ET.173.01.1.1]|uniref:carbohydrate ABC transporter permease n=1 Tax=Mesorhizobium sp. TaxID=1871066 RepID=UPI001092D57E|nr:sugar ABC transporter permease [Mesorhizobium sp.]TGV15094.1 sugar ABC transporter permease [Mesorhizobium sp. M8A.F.Ca.ET.173.01.1.1]TIT33470.1 MAG: sugar ABC transporter permease [Mesorhizobium sp.]
MTELAAPGLAPSMRSGRRFTSQTSALLLMLPPALVLFTLFVALPLFDAAYYSLFKWDGYGTPTDFIGLDNFKQALGHAVFWQAVRNTLIVLAVSVFVQLPIALGLALLIYEKTPANTLFRLIFFLPFILAEVASGLIWSFVFDGNTGVAAALFHALGMEPVFILADRHWAFAAITLVVVWKYFGFHMMIYIAALQGVPKEMLEAARLEGAGRWAIVRHVQVPMIASAIGVSVFFSIVGSLQLFDVVIPLTNGGPSNSTHTIVTYLYTFGLTRTRIGFGSAVGVMLFVTAVAFAVLYQRQISKGSRS